MIRAVISLPRNRARLIPLLLVFACAASGCLKATKPDLPRIFPPEQTQRHTGKNPVIVIPGVLGSQLVNRRTGERAWPSLFVNHDDSLALPITSPTLAGNTDDLVATEIVETARLARLLPEINVYASLLEALERYGGYRRGDLDAPAADGDRDTFYVFAYDWRRDNVESARLLARKIASLKARLGRPDLRFDIVAHSMGGLVARYCAMYGDRDTLTIAGSTPPPPDWAGARHLARLLLIGTPNAGSMDALRALLLGYSVTETNRPRITLLKKLDRDVTFTTPAVYQLLPHNAHARFLDAGLSPLKLDVFDLETWRQYGWSIAFDAKIRERELRALVKRHGEAEGARQAERLAAERERFLQTALARAAGLHRALNAASAPPDSLRLYLFGGDCEPTLDAVMIAEIKGRTRTLFRSGQAPGGRKARRLAFHAMFAPGDGRVTRRSLFALNPDPQTHAPSALHPLPHQAIFNCEVHGDLPLNLTLQDNLLTVLLGNRY
jgi:pimeloyl-ACP methyl ester carboxylesterase